MTAHVYEGKSWWSVTPSFSLVCHQNPFDDRHARTRSNGPACVVILPFVLACVVMLLKWRFQNSFPHTLYTPLKMYQPQEAKTNCTVKIFIIMTKKCSDKKTKTGFARLRLAFPAAGRVVKCQHQGSKQALLLLFPNNANKNSLIQQTTRKS